MSRSHLLCLPCLLVCACAPAIGFDDDDSAPAEDALRVSLETELGAFLIELFEDDAPVTTANFLAYVDAGFYDGADDLGATTFHRVVPDFVIQGGGRTETGQPKETLDPIVNEASNGLSNDRGTLSMARTTAPDTATSQFFVNLVDNPGLDPGGFTADGYAVFGRVYEGLDVVDRIAAQPGFDEVPDDPVLITSVERLP